FRRVLGSTSPVCPPVGGPSSSPRRQSPTPVGVGPDVAEGVGRKHEPRLPLPPVRLGRRPLRHRTRRRRAGPAGGGPRRAHPVVHGPLVPDVLDGPGRAPDARRLHSPERRRRPYTAAPPASSSEPAAP